MLLDKLKEYNIILASASPRRQQLLKEVGISYQLETGYPVDESYPDHLQGEEIPVFLAEKKSLHFPHQLKKEDILITADTIVYQDGEVLQKPGNYEEARESLRKISGNSHFVYTGICLRSPEKKHSCCTATEVLFDALSDLEIDYYIRTYKPFDKAGAYGIQEWIGYVGVKEIKGSYFNVMGLPIHKLYKELENFIHL
jgi:septum formation protein